jgi:protein-disulfide isomerase
VIEITLVSDADHCHAMGSCSKCRRWGDWGAREAPNYLNYLFRYGPMEQTSPSIHVRRQTWDTVSTVLTILSALAALVWVGWQWAHAPRAHVVPVPSKPVSLAGAWFLGGDQARTVLVEYSDFECTYCGGFDRDSLPRLRKEFVETGQVRFAFFSHPLERLHPHALRAALAADCAGQQGRFWQMHELLFADQQHLDDLALAARAGDLGLDLAAFRSCLDDPATRQRVQASAKLADSIGLSGTPSFVVGHPLPNGELHVTAVLAGASYADVAAALSGGRAGVWLWCALTVVLGCVSFGAIWWRRRTRVSQGRSS